MCSMYTYLALFAILFFGLVKKTTQAYHFSNALIEQFIFASSHSPFGCKGFLPNMSDTE